ncbi:MAG: glycosyltransferase [Candidatus Sungiibacteriota bacterium]|uniref:Glycosyltransferase n=1 Tax=Candidatus Sungiibacteriota bacterium TaxID=2750080 RepID=A0A7T5RJT4_9BACT|nr:MAG: glycosyltransferase [Candidatus Sungbacteria bacterium]
MSFKNSVVKTTAEKYTFDAYSPKRVSFFIITKNRAEYLARALEGAKKFIGPQDELIVIDGDSVDHTGEVAARYRDLIDVFISEPDTCGQEAQNKAILLARGKFLKPLMDDDIYHPEGVKQAIKALEAHPEIDLLICGGTKERNGVITEYCVPPGVNYGKSVEDVFRYKGAAEVGWFFRRDALVRSAMLFPESPNADNGFVLEFIKKGMVVKFCRLNTFHHFIYDHSMVVINSKGHLADSRRLVKEYCSPWFYLKYRLRNLDRELPFLARPWKIFKKSWDFVRHGSAETGKLRQPVLWDGGFS